MYEKTILLYTLCTLKYSISSKIVDSHSHDSIHVSDYCPKTEFCPEGTHVMCMYYDSKREMGPQCVKAEKVSITPDIANTLLHLVNAIRSKLALGVEKGYKYSDTYYDQLPRAYGMYKLQWDSELATFAQVLGNQCLMKFDLCRATKRFSNPSQVLGLIRFTYPDWHSIQQNKFKNTGLTPEKIHHSVVTAVKNWYMLKQYATAKDIKVYPNVTHKNAPRAQLTAKPYLEMISGEATHMGCGISAYTEYSYRDHGLIFNSVQIVCNLSAKPKIGKPVYTTTPPTQEGYTVRCGCPEGYDEDADCLCYETPPANSPSCNKMGGCKPAVVLLPIFTVEDAPKELPAREHLSYNTEEYPNMTALREPADDDIFAPYEINENQDMTSYNTNQNVGPVILEATAPAPARSQRIQQTGYHQNSPLRSRPVETNEPPMVRPMKSKEHISYRLRYEPESKLIQKTPKITVKKRYFDKNTMNPRNWRQGARRQDEVTYPLSKRQLVRSSIFSRAPKFELPGGNSGRRGNLSPYKIKINNLKRNMDVAPRKDFSYSQKLLDTYIIKRRSQDSNPSINRKPKDKKADIFRSSYNTITQTIDKTGHNLNHYLKNKFHYPDFNVTSEPLKNYEIKSSTDESDKKLMTLLDTLEQEVKHIDLDVTGKEMFDAKIRKIYGTVVGKSVNLLKPTIPTTTILDHDDLKKYDLNKLYTDTKNRMGDNIDDPIAIAEKKIFETEDKMKELNSKITDKYLPSKTPKIPSLPRNKNTLVPVDGKDIVNQIESFNKIGSIDDEMKKLNYLRNTLARDDEKSRAIGFEDKINKPFEDDLRHSSSDKSNANSLRSNKHTFDKSELKSRNAMDNMYRETGKHPSFEDMRFSEVDTPFKKRPIDSDSDFKTRNTYLTRNEISKIKAYEDLMKSKSHYKDYDDRVKSRFDDDVRNRNYKDYDMGIKDNNDDPLGLERRKFYQEKLENLERKLQSARASRRLDHESERARRLMRPPAMREGVQMRPSRTKNQMNFYLPDRARFLHGF